jgi:hypothetical protein
MAIMSEWIDVAVYAALIAGVGDRGLGALMEAKRSGHELNIRISDLERYGRTLLLDGVTADGKHVMMWNE